MKKEYTIEKYDWTVTVIYYDRELTDEGIKSIITLLRNEDCPETKINYIMDLIGSKNINSASCYSNNSKKKSVVIIGETSSDYELVNSITHEIIHLSRHINLCGNSENLASELGNLAGEIYKDIANK